MLHLKNEEPFRDLRSWLICYTLTLLLLTLAFGGQSHIIGPHQPIAALLGDDIILPCHLEPAVNAFPMRVEWARPDLSPGSVHVWQNGWEWPVHTHPTYEGRTSLSINKLKQGDVSLKLTKVKLSDEGTYRCFVPTKSKNSYVQLVVGAVSSPVVNITGINTSIRAVVLECESKGWYPEPEVLWLDGEGNLLSAGPTETVRGPDDLYTVSSRVTVEKRHSNSFTCRVQQNKTNQSRETHIHVPDEFFMSPFCFALGCYITLATGAVFGCVFSAALTWIIKTIRTRCNQKKENEEKEEGKDGRNNVKKEGFMIQKWSKLMKKHNVIENDYEDFPRAKGKAKESEELKMADRSQREGTSRERNNTEEEKLKEHKNELRRSVERRRPKSSCSD
ncbi:butyrophilin-like protein 10 [Lates calcarifer]|uniref:Butyrophilin-like protein 10 n=1 Tax=Lates calcarifer TaxID=8187 RepID=A0AAJ8DL17_LATCA|nr:butyrophilin-like protein 10 [Lates calcarifer]